MSEAHAGVLKQQLHECFGRQGEREKERDAAADKVSNCRSSLEDSQKEGADEETIAVQKEALNCAVEEHQTAEGFVSEITETRDELVGKYYNLGRETSDAPSFAEVGAGTKAAVLEKLQEEYKSEAKAPPKKSRSRAAKSTAAAGAQRSSKKQATEQAFKQLHDKLAEADVKPAHVHLSLKALKPAQAAWTSKFQELKTEYQAGRPEGAQAAPPLHAEQAHPQQELMIDEFKTVLEGYMNQIFPDAQSDADVSNAVDKLCQDAVDNAAAEWDRFSAARPRAHLHRRGGSGSRPAQGRTRAWKQQRSTRARDEDSGEDEKTSPAGTRTRAHASVLPTGSPRPAPSSTTPASAASSPSRSAEAGDAASPPRPPGVHRVGI